MRKIIELKIDPEFESLIPALTDEEFRQLKENILNDGEVLNPIITWQGIICDGHNRWKIIKENPGIPYKTYELIFTDKYQAKEWILKNQLGRRNITNEQRLRLIGQMQENRKQSRGGDRKSEESKVQNEPLMKSTAAQIAKEVGVSESTVKRAEKFSKGIDAIQEVSPEAATKILNGSSGVTKAEVMSVPQMNDEERKEFVDLVINPSEKSTPPPYTIDNLIQEVSASGDNYIRFLKDTLVKRSTMYAEQSDRNRVHDAVCSIKNRIEEIVNLLN